jgi:predicted transcriptional regulator
MKRNSRLGNAPGRGEKASEVRRMKLGDLARELGLRVCSGQEYLEREVTGGYCSDMLSDVMAHAQEGNIWLTIQTHQNIVAVASLLGLCAIVITGGGEPDADTLGKAQKEEVAILTTAWFSFETGGRIYQLLAKG